MISLLCLFLYPLSLSLLSYLSYPFSQLSLSILFRILSLLSTLATIASISHVGMLLVDDVMRTLSTKAVQVDKLMIQLPLN